METTIMISHDTDVRATVADIVSRYSGRIVGGQDALKSKIELCRNMACKTGREFLFSFQSYDEPLDA